MKTYSLFFCVFLAVQLYAQSGFVRGIYVQTTTDTNYDTLATALSMNLIQAVTQNADGAIRTTALLNNGTLNVIGYMDSLCPSPIWNGLSAHASDLRLQLKR